MNKDKLLQKYLDGDLEPDSEREALHLFADDEEMRAALRYEQRFQASFSKDTELESFTVPSGFSDRVMHNISIRTEAAEKHTLSSIILNKIRSWTEWFWRPRTLHWRPVYAVPVVLLLIAAIVLPYSYQLMKPANKLAIDSYESVQTVSESTEKVLLRFVFIDSKAHSIEVAGDFSNWNPIPLIRQTINGEQVWTGLVEMERGEHQYMFIRDGEEWVTDPLAPVQQDDGFGNLNAVVYL